MASRPLALLPSKRSKMRIASGAATCARRAGALPPAALITKSKSLPARCSSGRATLAPRLTFRPPLTACNGIASFVNFKAQGLSCFSRGIRWHTAT